MRSLFLVSIILSCSLMTRLLAQDVITMKNGDEIMAIVTEVLTQSVKYKRSDNSDGPVYTVDKTDIFMIKYENGTKDLFNDFNSAPKNLTSGGSATFYFYRPKKFASGKPKIIVGTAEPDEVVVNVKNGSWYKTEYHHLGERQFVTGVYAINPEVFTIDVQGGQTYYIKCTVLTKGLKVMAELEIVTEDVAKLDMASLKEQTQDYVK